MCGQPHRWSDGCSCVQCGRSNLGMDCVDGHTASNAPDFIRLLKLKQRRALSVLPGRPPGKTSGCCRPIWLRRLHWTNSRTHTHAHSHTHTHTYKLYKHTHTHTHARTNACTHARTHARPHARTHTHTHTHRHTDTQTHRHTDTHRHTATQPHRRT